MDKFKFGEFVYNRRSTLGLTQDELGRKLGVTNKAVSKWEVGETLPDINLMEPLANILYVSIDELYACEVQKKKDSISPINNKLSSKIKALIVILCISLIGLLSYTVVLQNQINRDKTLLKVDYIELNKDNYLDYLILTPCYRSVNEKDHLKIYGSLSLKDNVKYYDSIININVTYSIQYYYLTTNDSTSLITYLSKSVEVVYDNTLNEVTFVLEVKPLNTLTNFKEFKEFSLSYDISDITGKVGYKEN